MCQAIIDMKKEAYDNGFLKGEESGFQNGFHQGEESGFQNGFHQGEESGFQNGFHQGEESGFQNGFHQGEESGVLKGEENLMSKIALRMYNGKYDLQEISSVTGLDKDRIEKIIRKQVQ